MYVTPRSNHFCLALLAVSPFALGFAQQKPKAEPATNEFTKTVQPFIKDFCLPCHTGKASQAGFDMSLSKKQTDIAKQKNLWQSAAARVLESTMPPVGLMRPPNARGKSFADAVYKIVGKPPTTKPPVKGVSIRRLNRAEYNNTIRDLFPGIGISPADDFPSDDVGEGFDNIGSVLSISPLLMERYVEAAETIAEKSIQLPGSNLRLFGPESMVISGGANTDELIGMFANASAKFETTITVPGSYKLRVRAFAKQAGKEFAKLAIGLNGKRIATFEVKSIIIPTSYEVPTQLGNGKSGFELSFINDYYSPTDPDPKQRDRNLYIQNAELIGPIGVAPDLPLSHKAIMIAIPDPENPRLAAEQILSAFGTRAYRRPLTTTELDRLISLFQSASQGEPFERGIQVAIAAILCSPNFLFRTELDASNEKSRSVSANELSSRLSYFLWSSTPDSELQNFAKTGELLKPEVLARQIKRLIASQKSIALIENFASQWLQLRKLDSVSPDPEMFPEFSESLRASMRNETEGYFEYILRNARPVTELLDSNYAVVDERLAKLYGIQGVYGNQFRKVTLPDKLRGGVLTQASVLTVTSNPNRTSPVKRGKYVLEQILGDAPPPPPPGAGVIEGDTDKIPTKTMKQRLAKHRRDPNCSPCHLKMDTLGFAFENFDPIGKWRTKDGDFLVDTAGTLPDGTKIENASSLRQVLLKRKDEFVRALAKKLLTYALGRGLDEIDHSSVERIVIETKSKEYRLDAMIEAVATSPTFLTRRG
jgi:hypothetical protein